MVWSVLDLKNLAHALTPTVVSGHIFHRLLDDVLAVDYSTESQEKQQFEMNHSEIFFILIFAPVIVSDLAW